MSTDKLFATIVCLSGGVPFAYTGWTTSWSTDLDDALYVPFGDAEDIVERLQSLVHNSDKRYLVTVKTTTVEPVVEDELTDGCEVVADRLAALLLSPASQRAVS